MADFTHNAPPPAFNDTSNFNNTSNLHGTSNLHDTSNLHSTSGLQGTSGLHGTSGVHGTSNVNSTVNSNGTSNMDTLKNNATAAYDSVTSGPVAQNVKDQHAKTTAEFSNLANARQTPDQPAATGQPLTHYHSFFSELLSWNNPRASAIAYASIATFIFSVRYLDVLRWGFKLTWMVLGITIAAEVVGKTLMSSGLATQLRPRKYYTVPRETLDAMIGDVHELVNFFVIEAQRVLFAENVYASAAAAIGAFISYYMVKIVPYWGLALIATTVLFFVPLIYTSNQELIDHHIGQASHVVNAQTAQLRDAASRQTAHATQVTKQYMGDYTAKAQEMIRGAKAQAPAIPGTTKKEVRDTDFPAAPKESFRTSQPAIPVNSFGTTQPAAPINSFGTTKPAAPTKNEAEPLIVA